MIQYYMPRVLEDGEWLGWPDTDAKGSDYQHWRFMQMAHWVSRALWITVTRSPTTTTADPSVAIRCCS